MALTAEQARDSDYVTRVREYNRQLWLALQGLLAEQAQWNALDYAAELIVSVPGETTAHEGLTAAQIGAVVFDTANAFKVVLDAGHATNMSNIL